jgi:hypothetical protein
MSRAVHRIHQLNHSVDRQVYNLGLGQMCNLALGQLASTAKNLAPFDQLHTWSRHRGSSYSGLEPLEGETRLLQEAGFLWRF